MQSQDDGYRHTLEQYGVDRYERAYGLGQHASDPRTWRDRLVEWWHDVRTTIEASWYGEQRHATATHVHAPQGSTLDRVTVVSHDQPANVQGAYAYVSVLRTSHALHIQESQSQQTSQAHTLKPEPPAHRWQQYEPVSWRERLQETRQAWNEHRVEVDARLGPDGFAPGTRHVHLRFETNSSAKETFRTSHDDPPRVVLHVGINERVIPSEHRDREYTVTPAVSTALQELVFTAPRDHHGVPPDHRARLEAYARARFFTIMSQGWQNGSITHREPNQQIGQTQGPQVSRTIGHDHGFGF